MKPCIFLITLLSITFGCNNSDTATPPKKLLSGKEPTKGEKYQLEGVTKIETSCTYLIYEIDRLKIDLLKKAGEKHPSENLQPAIKPFSYDLSKLKNPNNQKVVNQLFIAKDGNNPGKAGKLLFDDFRTLRKELLTIAVSTEKQPVTIREFNDYSNDTELQGLLEKELASKDIAPQKDKQMIIQLYMELSLPDYKDYNGMKQHPFVYTFKNSEITSAFASLTLLQSRILKARVLALILLKQSA